MKNLIDAALNSIRKVQDAWESMAKGEEAISHPKGKTRGMGRKKPGTTGEGKYFRIVVRPKSDFVSFRNHDVGETGGLLRVAGKRSGGSWADQAWLISKDMAHLEGDALEPDDRDAKKILDEFGPVRRVKGDVFQGHPRKKTTEKEKPKEKQTLVQSRGRTESIRKGQKARAKRTRKAA